MGTVLESSPTFPLACTTVDEVAFAINQANLWMNIKAAVTPLHYDSYNNILVVVTGTKRVRLLSPSITSKLKPFSAWSTIRGANHSHVEDLNSLLVAGQLSSSDILTVNLKAGDALFIPEGYWHDVYSTECTMAINFWFEGAIAAMLKAESNLKMLPYILRTCFQSLAETLDRSTSDDAHDVNVEFDTWSADQFAAFMLDLHRVMTSDDSGGMKRRRTDDVDKAVTTITTEMRLVNTSLSNMERLWPHFSEQYPNEFGNILMSLSPRGAHVLLTAWDRFHDATGSFFTVLFRPCGERSGEIRRYLIAHAEEYLKTKSLPVLHDILGTFT